MIEVAPTQEQAQSEREQYVRAWNEYLYRLTGDLSSLPSPNSSSNTAFGRTSEQDAKRLAETREI